MSRRPLRLDSNSSSPATKKIANDGNIYNVDPDGDVLLNLSTSNAQPRGKTSKRDVSDPRTALLAEPSTYWIRVSAKHLSLASPYFRDALQKNLETAKLSSQTPQIVPVSDWNFEPFHAVLNIIHNRQSLVPRNVSWAFLVDFAAIVDHYQCHGSVEIFADIWQQQLLVATDQAIRDSFRNGTRLFVAWTFGSEPNLRLVGANHVRRGNTPLQVPNAVPSLVTDELERARTSVIAKILTAFSKLRRDLGTGKRGCSELCSTLLLGSLTKFELAIGLNPPPTAPYTGFSVDDIYDAVHYIREPVLYEASCSAVSDADDQAGAQDGAERPKPRHECSLRRLLLSDIVHADRWILDAQAACWTACSRAEGGQRLRRVGFSV